MHSQMAPTVLKLKQLSQLLDLINLIDPGTEKMSPQQVKPTSFLVSQTGHRVASNFMMCQVSLAAQSSMKLSSQYSDIISQDTVTAKPLICVHR